MKSKSALLEAIGNPAIVDKELRSFRKSAKVLSSQRDRLIDKYAKQWIAVYRTKVVANGRTIQSVLDQVDRQKLPREQVIVRFIDRNARTMVL